MKYILFVLLTIFIHIKSGNADPDCTPIWKTSGLPNQELAVTEQACRDYAAANGVDHTQGTQDPKIMIMCSPGDSDAACDYLQGHGFAHGCLINSLGRVFFNRDTTQPGYPPCQSSMQCYEQPDECAVDTGGVPTCTAPIIAKYDNIGTPESMSWQDCYALAQKWGASFTYNWQGYNNNFPTGCSASSGASGAQNPIWDPVLVGVQNFKWNPTCESEFSAEVCASGDNNRPCSDPVWASGNTNSVRWCVKQLAPYDIVATNLTIEGFSVTASCASEFEGSASVSACSADGERTVYRDALRIYAPIMMVRCLHQLVDVVVKVQAQMPILVNTVTQMP